MPCYSPLRAYRTTSGDVVFSELRRHDVSRSLDLSCGQCVGCRLERSRQWAIRCVHEASLYDENCFVTLTYSPDKLPLSGSLVYREFQLFMKRLRRRFSFCKIRFFAAGEYGGEKGRPHFHACLFGLDFPDKVLFQRRNGSDLFTSKILDELWGKGFCSVGALTFESAAYVARYIMKKVTGDPADEHYRKVDVETGEVVDLEPEFCHMSLKPGIGSDWLRLYWPEVIRDGEVVVRGKAMPAPKAYMRKLRLMDGYADVELVRDRQAKRSAVDRSDERLAVREVVARARLSSLKRKLT